MTPGPTELIIVLVIVLLLFGAKRLPDLASSMGKSIKEFRKATNDTDEDASTTDAEHGDKASPHDTSTS
jgi:sec-independent protein translocase protein TatA